MPGIDVFRWPHGGAAPTSPGDRPAPTGESAGVSPLRTLLICHEDAPLNREGLARWLASFSTLVGLVVLRESRGRRVRRIWREVRRVGVLRFLDVVLYRVYNRVFVAPRDREWVRDTLAELRRAYAPLPAGLPVLVIDSPNRPAAETFIRGLAPDLVIARCKTLLRESVFSIPPLGTFVMHPGICPEYRNAHGCFWALANGDVDTVGMTLLRIDQGVDTGPVYGYYSYPFDEARESPTRIQYRVVFENLNGLRERLLEIAAGGVTPLDTTGRRSAVWGQPWLTSYLRWKIRARRGNR
jgi:hypothetical protein